MPDTDVDGLGAAIFCRSFGACLVYFAYYTVPEYFTLVENTILVFSYPPWHHLPLSPLSLPSLEVLRLAMICSGIGLAWGMLPRICLVISGGGISYILSLDRTIYNNHYVLLILLCGLLLIAMDLRCLACRPWACASPVAPGVPWFSAARWSRGWGARFPPHAAYSGAYTT